MDVLTPQPQPDYEVIEDLEDSSESSSSSLKKGAFVLDTITTRFMTLFILVSAIPLLSLAWFSSDFLKENSEQEIQRQVQMTHDLFQNHLQSLKTETSQIAFHQDDFDDAPLQVHQRMNLHGSSICFLVDFVNKTVQLPTGEKLTFEAFQAQKSNRTLLESIHRKSLEKNTFLGEWNRQIYEFALVMSPNKAYRSRYGFLVGNPMDSVWLREFFQSNPTIVNVIWIVKEPIAEGQPIHVVAEGSKTQKKLKDPWRIEAVLKSSTDMWPNDSRTRYVYQLMQQILYDGLNQPIGRIVYIVPIEDLKGTINYYYLGFYIILLCGLLISVMVALWASRMIASPLFKLIEEVNALNRSDDLAGGHVSVQGFWEINQLGLAFNRMFERLQQEHQIKVDFVATLTHDLKVPLLAEKQTLKYLLNKTYGDLNEVQSEVLDVLLSSNTSSLKLVNDILEVYRYESGRVSLVFSFVDIGKVMAETIAECRSLADAKYQTVTFDNPLPEAIAYVDRLEIKRVIMNLVSNAITNTPRGGHIHCVVADETSLKSSTIDHIGNYEHNTLRAPLRLPGFLLISVQDTGIGFSPEDLENLFKRFGANRGRNPMSTGLGLYNCYQVVLAHRGSIWVETTEGEGTAVNFLLPAQQELATDRRKRFERRKN